MRWALASTVLVLLSGLTGCGGPDATNRADLGAKTSITSLPGSRVGELAEKELEAEHADMALGSVQCPDLAWRVDASVRCVKTSVLSGGRRLLIPGTVTVTSTQGWGKLHVVLDDQVAEFGLAGRQVASRVRAWVARHGRARSRVACPYLRGVSGATELCAVRVGGQRATVRVLVVSTDAATYSTRFTCAWKRAPRG